MLEGLREEDWLKIKQLVIEISPEHVSRIGKLSEQLTARGFQMINIETMGGKKYDKESQLACNLYAVR